MCEGCSLTHDERARLDDAHSLVMSERGLMMLTHSRTDERARLDDAHSLTMSERGLMRAIDRDSLDASVAEMFNTV